MYANFHEKAQFVKGRRGGLVAVETNGFLCPSRYASIRTFNEPTLFGGSVHYEIRLFGLPRRRCILLIGLSSSKEGGPSSQLAPSP
jgi:hypothetical protein